MPYDDLTRTVHSIESRLTSVDTRLANPDETDQAGDEALARVNDLAQEVRSRLSHLTWTVNLWGGAITILLGITLVLLP
jgi:hypothetical protein